MRHERVMGESKVHPANYDTGLNFYRWPEWKLKALARVAKSRGRAFFSDPRAMADLRYNVKRVRTKP